nr:lysophospholipid acyltransferase family protein [Rhodoferax sp.]
MLSWMDRGWRVLATAIAFTIFGLGGVALRVIIFPLLQVFVRDHAQRVMLARLTIHHAFRAFIGLMRFLGILRYHIEGLEKLGGRGQLVLANHPTLIDVVFLISLLPNADCVVKSALARNPFTRGPVRATNYICNDVGADLVQDCIASVKAGNSLVIFPEGTRTPVSGLMHLQRGAANIAVRGMCDITPVTIRCVPLSLTKGLPWWKVPQRRMVFTITVHDAIPVAPFIAQAGGELAIAARRLTEHLHQYFSTETSTHAGT